MADRTNEELLDKYDTADGAEWFELRAAVLARMAGPGEVVVPAAVVRYMLDNHESLWRKAELAAQTNNIGMHSRLVGQPNNGGNDDQGK